MGPKKSAAEKEAERLAAEEEERKQREAEEKKAAIEAEKRRVEELRIAAERKANRIAEVERLSAQYSEYLDDRKEKDEQRAKEEKLESDEIEWNLYRDPSEEPSARSEIETNSFLATMAEQPCSEMAQLVVDLKKIQKLAAGIEKLWAETDSAAEKNRLLKNLKSCIALSKKKVDSTTAFTLKFADMFLSTDGKYELVSEEAIENSVLAWWSSFSEMRPNRKKLDNFEKLGLQLDLPKQMLQAGILLLRILRTPYDVWNLLPQSEAVSATPSTNVFVVGDVLQIDLCVPPPQSITIRAKRWVIRDSSAASSELKRVPYPVTVKSTCLLKIAPTVVMTDDIRLAVYNDATGVWSEDGISEFQYSESNRQCQFYTTTTGTLALVKPRIADFPYKKWSLQPICDRGTMKEGVKGPYYEKQARFSIFTLRHEVVIDIVGSRCRLVKPSIPPLLDMIGVLMDPGALIHALQRRGINISPLYSDGDKIEGNVAKIEEFEDDILFAMSRCASAFEFKHSQWNKDLPPSQAGIMMRESTVYLGLPDTYDYECVLAEMDSVSESHKYAPDVSLVPGKSAAKYLLVFGNEYGDKKTFSHLPRPKEVHHVLLPRCMNNRAAEEAKERLSRTNERFAGAVYTLLKLVKPLSF